MCGLQASVRLHDCTMLAANKMQQRFTITEEQQTPKRQLFCHGAARSQCVLLAARPTNISQRTPLLLWHLLLLVELLLDSQATAHCSSTLTSAAD